MVIVDEMKVQDFSEEFRQQMQAMSIGKGKKSQMAFNQLDLSDVDI